MVRYWLSALLLCHFQTYFYLIMGTTLSFIVFPKSDQKYAWSYAMPCLAKKYLYLPATIHLWHSKESFRTRTTIPSYFLDFSKREIDTTSKWLSQAVYPIRYCITFKILIKNVIKDSR